jgi:hypothetical protein
VYSKKSLIVTVVVVINVRDEEVDFLLVGFMVKREREGVWTMKKIRQEKQKGINWHWGSFKN